MLLRLRSISHIPLLAGLLILTIIILLTPWKEVWELLRIVRIEILALLLLLSVLFYGAKAVRYWYILRLLEVHVPIRTTILLYFSGQALSLLPAGELYRSILLKKYFGVRLSHSAPTLTIQGIIEGIVLVLMVFTAALAIGYSKFSVSIIGLLIGIFILSLRRGWLEGSHTVINKLPYISIDQEKFAGFIKSHKDLLATRSLLPLIGLSFIPVFSGVAMLIIASNAVGFSIGYAQSVVGYSLPVVLSGLSFLPGGLGVTEGGSIGILQLFGATTAAAITITLLLRIFTLVIGLIYGSIAQLILHFKKTGSDDTSDA